MNKQIIAVVAIVLAVALFIGFRSKISQLISFQGIEQTSSESPVPSSSVMPSESVTPVSSETNKPAPDQMPVYKGRPEDELRPDPEEVKLFSEAQKQDFYRSLQNFGKNVKENPDLFNSWIQLGLLKKIIGDYEGARDAWEYASAIRPGNNISFANLGELYWRYLHVFDKSEASFKMAIKNNPNDTGVYASMSDLYFYSLKAKANLADDILLQGIAANPKSLDLPKKLADLYERQGEYAKAIEQWEKLLAQDTDNADYLAKIDSLKKKLVK